MRYTVKNKCYLILLYKCILLLHMFINVYKNSLLQQKIRNTTIVKNGRNNT